jgi:hypothetical protein
VTPQQRDREARAVVAIARACGFGQPVAPLILRRVPDVDRLLRSDDATIRRVLGDPQLRTSLRSGLMGGFEAAWKQATLERIRLDHPDWLRAWWLPVTSAGEFDRLLRTPPPRSDDKRVGLARRAYPATAAAAEVLVDRDHRSEVDGYLLVERRIAAAVLDLAHEIANEEGGAVTGGAGTLGGADRPPEGIDPRDHPYVAWWHGA